MKYEKGHVVGSEPAVPQRGNLTDLSWVINHLDFYDVLREYPPEIAVSFLRQAAWHDDGLNGRRDRWRQRAATMFAELPEEQRERARERFVAYMSTRMVDALITVMYEMVPGYFNRYISVDGIDHWWEVQRTTGRAVTVSPHWGPYLAAPPVLRTLGMRVTAPIDGVLVEPWEVVLRHFGIDRARMRFIGLPGPSATGRMLADLADGFSPFVTPDFNLGRDSGLKVPFLGRAMPASTGAARVALEGRVPLLPVVLTPVTPLTYRLVIGPPLYRPGQDVVTAEALTHRVFYWLERVVAGDPALWWGWTVYQPAESSDRPSPAGT
jgi:lauroyl/myristoyl acyltransferase